MRLIVAQLSDGQTTTNRQSAGGENTASRCPHHRCTTTTRGPSDAASGFSFGNAGANRCHLRRGPSHGGATAAAFRPIGTARREAHALGRPAQSATQCRTRSAFPGPVGRAGQAGGRAGALADPSGLGAAVGPAGGGLGRVAAVGSARVAQNGPRYTPPQERSGGAGGVEKKLPETLAAIVKQAQLRGCSVRVMFQDEARFGRMARPRRCWAPLPWRPVMLNGYERQFVYVYGALSPLQGDLDWMICGEMNTVRMGEFLGQVSHAHPDEFIVMIVDGASSHKAKDLAIPENIRLVPLPAYAPELNAQEHVWDELREKEFPNRVFHHMDAVIGQLHAGLPRFADDHDRVRSLTASPWIVSLNIGPLLNDHYLEISTT